MCTTCGVVTCQREISYVRGDHDPMVVVYVNGEGEARVLVDIEISQEGLMLTLIFG